MSRHVTTKLITHKGEVTQEGIAGFTVTAERDGDHMYTKIEYSDAKAEEVREMVAVLLCMLEDLRGEAFITACFARYAQETGKKFLDQENGRKLVIIRGTR